MRIRIRKRKFRWFFDTNLILADRNVSVAATFDFPVLESLPFGFCRN